MMPLLLDSNPVSSDEDFKYACNDSEARLFVENMWNLYREYADKDFTKKIARKFHNHFWEMYLACTLKDNGNDLLPKTKIKMKGPDIEIKNTDDSRIWVEAIIATSGIGKNSVPLPKLNDKGLHVPEEKIVLRYTTAIDAKYKKYLKYKDENVISESEPYIIAINGNQVPYASDWDDEIPYICQAVFPFGLPNLEINWDNPKDSIVGYDNRPEIKSGSGAAIPTNIFLNKEYEGISGIIFSRISIYKFHDKMGKDFIFIHNPLARNKLPEGWLKIGREYRFRSFLECRRW